MKMKVVHIITLRQRTNSNHDALPLLNVITREDFTKIDDVEGKNLGWGLGNHMARFTEGLEGLRVIHL